MRMDSRQAGKRGESPMLQTRPHRPWVFFLSFAQWTCCWLEPTRRRGFDSRKLTTDRRETWVAGWYEMGATRRRTSEGGKVRKGGGSQVLITTNYCWEINSVTLHKVVHDTCSDPSLLFARHGADSMQGMKRRTSKKDNWAHVSPLSWSI